MIVSFIFVTILLEVSYKKDQLLTGKKNKVYIKK